MEKKIIIVNNKKNYYEGFINGIMLLMVKFKSKSNISFDILFEKDDFVTEAIRRIGTSKEYKTPNERGDQ